MAAPINLREISLNVIIDIMEKGKFSHIALKEVLDKNQSLSKQERSFITRLTEGTVERVIELDWIINRFSKTNTVKMKPLIKNILRMSVYQLKYMSSVPDSAVCNEAAKLTSKRGLAGLKGFVNGVLRNIARDINKIEYPDDLSIKYSMPQWIIDKWIEVYGKEKTADILDNLFVSKKTSVRCNLSRASKQEIVNSLNEQGIEAEEYKFIDSALLISGYDYINNIKAHNEGLIQVQDISSMFVGIVAEPKKGDTVIDVCAAPGGKSLHIADLLFGTGCVISRDITKKKIDLIDENIKRSGMKNIKSQIADACISDDKLEKTADVVIADLPCSGLGILNKKSDIKYRIDEKQLEELSSLQRKILAVVQRYVKEGGTLVYSTCTINKSENEENVKWFLDNYPYEAVSVEKYFNGNLTDTTLKDGFIQMLPTEINDGFFIAKFRRKSNE